MPDHVQTLPMNLSRPMWRLLLYLLVLTAPLGCGVAKSHAKSNYEIVNTGITGGGCWYDDSHFIVVQGHQPASGDGFVMEGLYVLDPHKPKELVRIDLSPIEPNEQKRIRNVTCQEQTIVFTLPSAASKLQQIYALTLGAQPELMVELRIGSINLRGRYVFNTFRRPGQIEDQGLQGVGIYEAHPDCGIKYVKSGFKTLCVDTWMEFGWVLPSFRFTPYSWYESVKVKNKAGQETWVRNPEPPLKLSDGRELKQGYLLRDLENRNQLMRVSNCLGCQESKRVF
jgi:hypothetical protein